MNPKGYLHQKILVILQIDQATPSDIVSNKVNFEAFKDFVVKSSNQIIPEFTYVEVNSPVDPSEYQVDDVDDPTANPPRIGLGRLACFTSILGDELTRQGINPEAFDSIFRVYSQDFNSRWGGGTHGYYNHYLHNGPPRGPGLSTLPLQDKAKLVNVELLIHEFLHQLDLKFDQQALAVGAPGSAVVQFVNPDYMDRFPTTLGSANYSTETKLHFYKNIFRYTAENNPDGTPAPGEKILPPPPYQRLHGIMGQWVWENDLQWMGQAPAIRWDATGNAGAPYANIEIVHTPGAPYAVENRMGVDVHRYVFSNIDYAGPYVFLRDDSRNARYSISPDGYMYFNDKPITADPRSAGYPGVYLQTGQWA